MGRKRKLSDQVRSNTAKRRGPAQIVEREVLHDASAKIKLSAELAGELDASYGATPNDSNVLIADPNVKKAKQVQEPAPSKRLSGRQLKRLRKVIAQKEKKQRRAQLLEDIASQSLPTGQAALLHSSSSISSKMTLKQRLRQELKERNAGISVSTADGPKVRLTVPRVVRDEGAESSSEDDEDQDDDEDDDANQVAVEQALPTPQVLLLPRRHSGGPVAQDLMRRPIVHRPATKRPVEINRPHGVQENRLQLPILQEEHSIMEAVLDNSVVIICGETGSGKTTQLPQFLFEAGFTRGSAEGQDSGERSLIGVTEPRRIAAISMAKRVGHELGLNKREVSYQVRYQGTMSSATEIKFMTDGVLTKEIETDFALRKYSVIVVDEAHERSVHTDILLGLLSRIVPLREKMAKQSGVKGKPAVLPLKLIIMSATLRVKDFTENDRLFPKLNIPVLSVDARQYPVGLHFSRRTTVDTDNVAAAYRKVCQIHTRLPQGGILVFMTGQSDIRALCTQLRKRFNSKGYSGKVSTAANLAESDTAKTVGVADPLAEFDGELSDSDVEDDEFDRPTKSHMQLADEPSDDGAEFGALRVLPLFSALSQKEQSKVFESIPEGQRLCVVATNVAETSLTIPGIRYVVDTGQVKYRLYDDVTGVTKFKVDWISKASADQRAGRAGRTGPGHCYRLYSSAVYNNEFPQFAVPEIKRMPVDGLMLQMKAMNIEKVVNFPFPTPPDRQALLSAEKLLCLLGALDRTSKKITTLGKAMAKFPVAPRFSKMLCLARHYNCFQYVAAIVSAMTVQEIFAKDAAADLAAYEDDSSKETEGKKKYKEALNQWKLEGIAKGGDLGATLCAVGACDYMVHRNANLEQFCFERALRYKAVVECNKLRKQLNQKEVVQLGHTEEADEGDPSAVEQEPLAPPSAAQEDAIRQIILSGFGDCVARASPDIDKELAKHGVYGYNCTATDELVYIHPSSVFHRQRPEYLVYHTLVRGRSDKLYMKGLTIIQPEWLGRLVPSMCAFGKPLENPAPRYDANKDDIRACIAGSYGSGLWQLPAVEMSYPSTDPDRYRYFARFLLDGTIFSKLRKFVSSLKNKPEIMNKPWVKERVVAILQPLVNNQIDTKAKLSSKWSEEPKFLMKAYSLWLPSEKHGELVSLWPPIDSN